MKNLNKLIESRISKLLNVPQELLQESASKTILSSTIQQVMYDVENNVSVDNDSDEEDDLWACLSHLKKAHLILLNLGL